MTDPAETGDGDRPPASTESAAREHPLKRELYQRVREHDEIFEFLQSGSLDGLWYLDLEDVNRAWLSPRFKQVFGFEPDEVSDTTSWWQERIFHEDAEGASEAFRNHLADPSVPYDHVLRYRHKDGSTVWIRCRGMALRDTSGRPVRMLGAHTDITRLKQAEHERGRAEAEQSAERRFRELIEVLPQLVWTCDADGQCTYLNQRWLDYTGQSLASQRGRGWREQVHPDDRPSLTERWAAAQGSLEPLSVEYRLLGKDGSYRWFDVRAVPERDAHGKVLRWVGSNTDVHDAHEMRAALRVEKERLSGVMASSPGVVLSLRHAPDGSLTFPFASQSALELYGVTPEQMARDAAVVLDHIHPDDSADVAASITESARTMRPWRMEFRFVHASHGVKWLAGHSMPVRDPDGGTTWSGVVLDISEQKRREQELSIVKSQLDAALEAADMGAYVVDIQAGTVWESDGLRRLYGYGDDVPQTQSTAAAANVVHPDDRQHVREQTVQQLMSHERFTFEFRIKRPTDGAVRFMANRAQVVRGPGGAPSRLVGVIMDITRQKLATEAKARSQKLEALGTLAGGIAHDFNNVLQAIGGRSGLALSELAKGSPAREHVVEIARASTHGSELVARILGFSRPREQQRTSLRLPEVIDEALALVRATIPTSIELRTNFASDVPAVTCDPSEVQQIVVNLATNAAHAIGRRQGLVELKLEHVLIQGELSVPGDLKPGVYARLSLSDDGSGMDSATMARIFDPYFTTKPVGEGTGLGLAVVASIMRTLSGTVTVYSKPGKGTTFQLYFPEATAAARAPEPATRSSLPAGRGERVLFVDDEPALASLGRETLRHLGYVPDAHDSPKRALDSFRAEPASYAAVITDLSMPGISGFELARAVHELRPDLPVVMMSGYARPEERERAQAEGIAHLIQKPVSLHNLASTLALVLRQG